MKKTARIPAFLLYGLSLLCLAVYLFCSVSGAVALAPIHRLLLLGLVCAASYAGSLWLTRTLPDDRAYRLMKATFAFIFAIYLLLLVTLVLFDSYFGRVGLDRVAIWSREAFGAYLADSLNLIPFKTIVLFVSGLFTASLSVDTVITNLLGNLAAFAPFAFFLPLLFRKIRSIKRFLLAMICIVLAVELAQLILLTGSCDIDDLILNVGGACVFYGILHIKVIRQIISKITRLPY